MMFMNDNDRKMYELLYVLRNGTPEQIAEYIDSLPPTPEEEKNSFRERHKNQSREELQAELIDQLMQIQEHINKTYFTGEEGGEQHDSSNA